MGEKHVLHRVLSRAAGKDLRGNQEDHIYICKMSYLQHDTVLLTEEVKSYYLDKVDGEEDGLLRHADVVGDDVRYEGVFFRSLRFTLLLQQIEGRHINVRACSSVTEFSGAAAQAVKTG